ncbi:CobW family GTP-binding protein [Microlunatus parietis]|uniref:G3E family GTPase n=2 Tax=Microlunatus parietis TaxID=682979 RepID=A0A7Y9LEJ7_9ACTN|nr:G3E family GTPase [Microlunatus parietis]
MNDSSPYLSVAMIAAVDPVARQSAAATFLLDLPDAAQLSYDLAVDRPEPALRRVIADRDGTAEAEFVDLDHGCLGCTLRQDVLATLARLTDIDRWRTVVLALPLATPPEPVAAAVDTAVRDGRLVGIRLAPVVAAVDGATAVHDILGDDLLDERDLAHGPRDRRSVGEAVCAQVEYADAVLAVGNSGRQSVGLLRRLLCSSAFLASPHRIDVADLIVRRHDTGLARARIHPLQPAGRPQPDADGVWTLVLQSGRPFEPQRLMARLEDLGTGLIRARGHFWLPSRPGVACVWDGSGGQLSVGIHGPWGDRMPGTALTITGVDPTERERIRDAFATILMTDRELGDLDRWRGVDDGFDPWLGTASSAA